MTTSPDAPRFRLLLEKVENRSVLTMPRAELERLAGHAGQPVEIDVADPPLGSVAHRALVAVAQRAPIARIEIYRYDERDMSRGTPVNVDRYTVVEDAGARWDVPVVINAASTSDNENLRQSLPQTVFIIKEEPGADHWLPSLPETVVSIVRRI